MKHTSGQGGFVLIISGVYQLPSRRSAARGVLPPVVIAVPLLTPVVADQHIVDAGCAKRIPHWTPWTRLKSRGGGLTASLGVDQMASAEPGLLWWFWTRGRKSSSMMD